MKHTPVIIIDDVKGQEDSWLEKRRGMLTASELPIATGLMPRICTPMQLWARKMGIEPEPSLNDAMFLGLELEPIVAKMVTRHTGEELKPVNRFYGLKEVPWIGATPDYENLDGTKIFQLKTSSSHAAQYWQDGIPDYAHIQVQVEMGCTGIHKGAVAALVGGRDFYIYDTEFNEDVFAQILSIGEKFMECIKSQTPPIPYAEDAGLINKLLDRSGLSPDVAELPDSALTLVERYEVAKAQETALNQQAKVFEAERKAIELQLRQVMGDCREGRIAGRILKQSRCVIPARSQAEVVYYRFSVKED